MGVLDAIVQGHLTADGQQRIPLRGGGGQARNQVGDTRPRRSQADPHFAGHTAHRLGHESGILLVPAEHQLDRRIEQSLKDAVDLGARDPENMGHPMLLKQLDQNLGAVHYVCFF